MSILRFLMLLSLIIWLGGLIFFAFVLAPTVFSVLPSRHWAGSVVSPSLAKLNWMGLVSGITFLMSSMVYSRLASGAAHPWSARHLLIMAMLLLTLTTQFFIMPRMNTLRVSRGAIDELSETDPARVKFNALHLWSTRLEMGVMIAAVVVVYLTAGQFR